MGLKLTVEKEDKITLSNGVVIDVLEMHRRGAVTLEFTAPEDVKIYAIFKDSTKQFKNQRRKT